MSDEESSVVGTRPPAIIRGACVVMMVVGVLSVALSGPAVFDPAGARCEVSRRWIDDANTDKKDWNNVDTGGVEPKKLPCAEAIRLADQIPLKEKGTKTASVPSEGALSFQAGLAVIGSLGQSISGMFLLRTLSRRTRSLAIGFSAAGLVMRILGILSLGVFVFVVYALAFSAASRELWPKAPREPRKPR